MVNVFLQIQVPDKCQIRYKEKRNQRRNLYEAGVMYVKVHICEGWGCMVRVQSTE